MENTEPSPLPDGVPAGHQGLGWPVHSLHDVQDSRCCPHTASRGSCKPSASVLHWELSPKSGNIALFLPVLCLLYHVLQSKSTVNSFITYDKWFPQIGLHGIQGLFIASMMKWLGKCAQLACWEFLSIPEGREPIAMYFISSFSLKRFPSLLRDAKVNCKSY